MKIILPKCELYHKAEPNKYESLLTGYTDVGKRFLRRWNAGNQPLLKPFVLKIGLLYKH